MTLYGERILGRLVKWLIRLLRRTNPDRASDVCGALARRIGPWLPAHRIGQANLRAAFPDKDAAWIEQTLREAWDNLGRVAGEYVHMARIWDFDLQHPNTGRIETDSVPMFEMLRTTASPRCASPPIWRTGSCRRSPPPRMACHRRWFTGCPTTRRWRRKSSASARR